jgi:hypothetical protein
MQMNARDCVLIKLCLQEQAASHSLVIPALSLWLYFSVSSNFYSFIFLATLGFEL